MFLISETVKNYSMMSLSYVIISLVQLIKNIKKNYNFKIIIFFFEKFSEFLLMEML
ncbi:unnamed protein product [Arabidopsis halleri]